MDNRNEGMPWLVSIYTKFEESIESMRSEVDGILRQQQDGFEYVENTLPTVGASIKQFLSDFVQDILPPCFGRSVQAAANESSLAQNTNEANKLSNEGIDEDKLEKEAYNAMPLQHSLPQGPKNFSHPCISVQNIIDSNSQIKEDQAQFEMFDIVTSEKKDSSLSVSSPISDDQLQGPSREGNQVQFEMSDNVFSDKEDPNLLALSGIPEDIRESSGFPSSLSGSSFRYIKSEVLDIDDVHSNARAEITGKSSNSIDDTTSADSSHKIEFDESCILVDNGELSQVCHETATLRSCKEKLQASTENQEESCDMEREGPLSSGLITSNHGLCQSDWVII